MWGRKAFSLSIQQMIPGHLLVLALMVSSGSMEASGGSTRTLCTKPPLTLACLSIQVPGCLDARLAHGVSIQVPGCLDARLAHGVLELQTWDTMRRRQEVCQLYLYTASG